MFCGINYGIMAYQSAKADSVPEIEQAQQTLKWLKYTPWIDIALSLIFSLLGILCLTGIIQVNALFFFVPALIEVIVGGGFLKAEESLQELDDTLAVTKALKSL
jgi:hypothetical protein